MRFLIVVVFSLFSLLFVGCSSRLSPADAGNQDAYFFVSQAVMEGEPIVLSDTGVFPKVEIKRFGKFTDSTIWSDSIEYWYDGKMILKKTALQVSRSEYTYPHSGIRCRVGWLTDRFGGIANDSIPAVVIADYTDFHGGPSQCGARAELFLGSKLVLKAQSDDFGAVYYVAPFRSQPNVKTKIVAWESGSCFSIVPDDYINVSYYDFEVDTSCFVGQAKFTLDNLRKTAIR
jgi:hypothetical protein